MAPSPSAGDPKPSLKVGAGVIPFAALVVMGAFMQGRPLIESITPVALPRAKPTLRAT
jgi:hypothetical protein